MSSADRRIHQHWSVVAIVHRVLDAVAILGAIALAMRWEPPPAGELCLAAGAIAVIAYYLIAEVSGLYRSWRGVSTELEMLCAVVTWLFTLPVLVSLGYFAGRLELFSRSLIVSWFLIAPLLMVFNRSVIRWIRRMLRKKGWNTRRYAIVGVNELGFQLAHNIKNSEELGLEFVGFYDDRPADRVAAIPLGVGDCVGKIEDLVEHARRRNVDMIYVTFPMRAEQRIKRILDQLSDTTASVYVVPDFFVFELLHSRWTNINGLPVVSIFENPFYGVDGLVKRGLDMALAGLFLLVAAVPMLIIAVAIKWTSPGPVFFRQKRYGLDGREILIWKFRTMRVCEDGGQMRQATRDDPRVTQVGAILRKTSLDELPQLFNVLEGTMSLVGPRPHASVHNETFRKMIHGYMLRHKVKPGITGLAQVNGCRGETDTLIKMEQRIQYDHRYIREWSLWMDLKILFKTFFVVWSTKNAY